MGKVRNTMLFAAVAATAVASVGGYVLLGGPPTRILLDAGLCATLVVIIYASLTPTEQRVATLVEALRALARGERHQRVSPDDFAGLADVARALNEVAASLTENEDPNLGPVRSQPRPARPVSRSADEQNLSDHPELGPVRPMRRASRTEGTDAASEVRPSAAGAASSGEPPGTGAATHGAATHGAATHGAATHGAATHGAATHGAAPGGVALAERSSVVSEPRKSAARSGPRPQPMMGVDGGDEVSEPRRSTRAQRRAGDAAGDAQQSAPRRPAEDTGPEDGAGPAAPRPSSAAGAGTAGTEGAIDLVKRTTSGSDEPDVAPPAAALDAGPSDAERDASLRDDAPSRTNDTAIDPAKAADDASATGGPTRAEIEQLFHDFISRKRNKDQSVMDVDLDAFAETIASECERLLAAHKCKGVRFEVAEVEGEVSLRPRLIR